MLHCMYIRIKNLTFVNDLNGYNGVLIDKGYAFFTRVFFILLNLS